MTDADFKRIMNARYGAYGQHDVGAVYISTDGILKEREMNCNEKLKNYLCTRCKYKNNGMVPCYSCDGVSEFVEQSRSKYRDGLDQYTDMQRYLKELYGCNNVDVRKEKEMSKVTYRVNSAGIAYCPTIRRGECEISVPIKIIDDRPGELFINKGEFAVHLENLLNGNECGYAIPKIKNVIFNGPATIVFWADGTKTVVKCQEGDIFDPEKGLTMAITKKALGNQGNYCNEIKKWCDPWYEDFDMESNWIYYTASFAGPFDKAKKDLNDLLKRLRAQQKEDIDER